MKRMNRFTRASAFALAIAAAFLALSCSGFFSQGRKTASLTIHAAHGSPTAMSRTLWPDSVDIAIHHYTYHLVGPIIGTEHQVIDYDNETTGSHTFADIDVGAWTATVYAKNQDGIVLLEGSQGFSVSYNALTENVTVQLSLAALAGDTAVSFQVPQDVVSVSGTIKLEGAASPTTIPSEDLSFTPGNPGTGAYTASLPKGTYWLTVDFFNDQDKWIGLLSEELKIFSEITTDPAAIVFPAGSLNAPPGAPTITAATPDDADVALTWEPGSGSIPESYTIYYQAGETLDTATADTIEDAASGDLVGSLANGSAYTFAVAAVNAAGETLSDPQTRMPLSPIIELSPSSLGFLAATGAASPGSKTVSVTAGNASVLDGLGATVSYADGSGWLEASLDGAAAPATLTVQAKIIVADGGESDLAGGEYDATVRIASSTTSAAYEEIAVHLTLTVSGGLNLTFVPVRILVMEAYQAVTFANESAKLCSIALPADDDYSISWSDSYEGSGTVDVVASLYRNSACTDAVFTDWDSGYTTPYQGAFTAGTYYLKLSAKGGSPVTGTCSARVLELLDPNVITLSHYDRLLVADEYSRVSFSDDAARWLVLDIAEAGSYAFTWSDSKQGRAGETADVELTLFSADKSTTQGGFSALDSGYTTPYTLSLDPGRYFLRAASFDGPAITGSFGVKATPVAVGNQVYTTYYQRLLAVDGYSQVDFAGESLRRLVFDAAADGSFTLDLSDAGAGDGFDSVDVLVSFYDEEGFAVGSYSDIDSAYGGTPIALTAGVYHLTLEIDGGAAATGHCKIKLFQEGI